MSQPMNWVIAHDGAIIKWFFRHDEAVWALENGDYPTGSVVEWTYDHPTQPCNECP